MKCNHMSSVNAGMFVRIDLSTCQHTLELFAEHDIRTYPLGSGFAAKLFYDEMDPSIGLLDLRAVIYVFNGLSSGTFAPTGCRSSLVRSFAPHRYLERSQLRRTQ